jgi:hypothetical protein
MIATFRCATTTYTITIAGVIQAAQALLSHLSVQRIEMQALLSHLSVQRIEMHRTHFQHRRLLIVMQRLQITVFVF